MLSAAGGWRTQLRDGLSLKRLGLTSPTGTRLQLQLLNVFVFGATTQINISQGAFGGLCSVREMVHKNGLD